MWEVLPQKQTIWSKSFIDLQNDVTTKDIRQAISEGFDRIEHLKRYTTNSMGTDQGKISSINEDVNSNYYDIEIILSEDFYSISNVYVIMDSLKAEKIKLEMLD